MLTATTLDEHKRAISLALLTTGLVLAAALGSVMEPLAAFAIAALAMAPLALVYLVHAPWVMLGIYIIVAPWVLRATEIELGAGIPNLNFERLGIYGIFAIVLFRILTGKQDRLPLTTFDRAWLMLIGAMLLSGLVMGRTPPQTVRQVVNENLYPFIAYFGMKHLVSRPKQARTVAMFLMLAATILGLHAFADQVLGLQLSKVDRSSITTNAQIQELGGFHSLQLNRAGGPLGNSIVLGVSLIQGAVLGFFLFLTERRLLVRALAATALVFCSIGVAVTYTRSVYFAFLCCTPFLWFWYPRFRRAILVGGGLGALAILAYLPIAVSDPENRLLNFGSILERFGMWVTSFYFIKASPLIGHGYGFDTYPALKAQGLVPHLEFIGQRYLASNTTPHNEFLRMWITMGVVGLALYCRFLWTMFAELNHFRKSLAATPHLRSMRPLIIVAACGMVGFYGQSVFTDMTAMNYADTVVFMFLGVVLGVHDNHRRKESNYAYWSQRGRAEGSGQNAGALGARPDPLNEF